MHHQFANEKAYSAHAFNCYELFIAAKYSYTRQLAVHLHPATLRYWDSINCGSKSYTYIYKAKRKVHTQNRNCSVLPSLCMRDHSRYTVKLFIFISMHGLVYTHTHSNEVAAKLNIVESVVQKCNPCFQ